MSRVSGGRGSLDFYPPGTGRETGGSSANPRVHGTSARRNWDISIPSRATARRIPVKLFFPRRYFYRKDSSALTFLFYDAFKFRMHQPQMVADDCIGPGLKGLSRFILLHPHQGPDRVGFFIV